MNKLLLTVGLLMAALGEAQAFSLTLDPPDSFQLQGSIFTLQVVARDVVVGVNALSLSVSFDPTAVIGLGIAEGPFLAQISGTQMRLIDSVDNPNGVISYVVARASGATATGTGTAATITFQCVALGTTVLVYDLNLADLGGHPYGGQDTAIVRIVTEIPTNTSTYTGTWFPVDTPTRTATDTPTKTATRTATPTRSPTPILTPTVTFTPTVTPTFRHLTIYVDNDAPNDPGPNDPNVSDPLADGSAVHPFDSVQKGINAAMNGDEVVVLPGTYGERADFHGKGITVRSTDPTDPSVVAATVIHGNGMDSAFHLGGSQTSPAVLSGFTIQNSSNEDFEGGGVCCGGSSTTISYCTFSGNSAHSGGAMLIPRYSSTKVINCTFSGNWAEGGGAILIGNYSAPTIMNCTFIGNTATSHGGAILSTYSSPTVINCTFSDNWAAYGGAMSNVASSSTAANCTFSGNSAWYGADFFNERQSSASITNSILWGDSPGCAVDSSSSLYISYSDVQGGEAGISVDSGGTLTWGDGNIDADPLLNSNLGLTRGSPCIDSANGDVAPPSDKDGLPRFDDPMTPNTGIGSPNYVDMGAYEYQGTLPLAVISFAVNAGRPIAWNRQVILNNLCTGRPTEYMASELNTFAGATWQTYSRKPLFTLSSGNGIKTIYLKVRNAANVESNVAVDAIFLAAGGR